MGTVLDSSTPLRFAQNDSDGVAFSSMESGPIVKDLRLSAVSEGKTIFAVDHGYEVGLPAVPVL